MGVFLTADVRGARALELVLPGCSKTAARNIGSSSGAVPRPITGDFIHTGQAVSRQLAREDRRCRYIARRRIEAASWRAIAAELGVTHGSAQSAFLLAMQAIWKRLNAALRYHLTGRARKELPAPRPRT